MKRFIRSSYTAAIRPPSDTALRAGSSPMSIHRAPGFDCGAVESLTVLRPGGMQHRDGGEDDQKHRRTGHGFQASVGRSGAGGDSDVYNGAEEGKGGGAAEGTLQPSAALEAGHLVSRR